MNYPVKRLMKCFRVVWRGLFLAVLAVAVGFSLSSAGGNETTVGGPCQYEQIPGRAVITVIVPYEDGSKVYFKFIPKIGTDLKHGLSTERDYLLTINYVEKISADFLKERSIATGNEYEAVAEAITAGTCTPLIFRIPVLE